MAEDAQAGLYFHKEKPTGKHTQALIKNSSCQLTILRASATWRTVTQAYVTGDL